MLSEETTSRFRAALREHCSDAVRARSELHAAVSEAAAAAKDADISAEHFVIWVKQMWGDMMDEGRLADSTDPAGARDAVISAAIKAYYVQ